MEPDRALVPPLERAVHDRNGAVAVEGYLVHEKPCWLPLNGAENCLWFGADGIRTGTPSLLPTNSTPRLPERKRGDELTGGLEPPACALQVRCSTR